MINQVRLHKQDLEKIQNFRIFDDDFLKEVFENNIRATKLVLNIVLERDDINVTTVIGQREIKGLEGHSVKLDITAEDSTGKVYNIEIHREDRHNLPKRARYYSSMMDTILLKPKEDYSNLVPTYVIFFTEADTIGDGEPLHHYVMKDLKNNSPLDDERHIIFVNGKNEDTSTALGKLIHDFKCASASDMFFDELSEKVRYFKETEGGVSHMCKMLEEMRNETAILATIDTCQTLKVPEAEIKSMIMDKYNLTETQALDYMNQKIA